MSYAKLRGRIREKYHTQDAFATAMGMNASTLSAKLTGTSEWTKSEIAKAAFLLGIACEDIHIYFFAE